ncbi:MAG: MFS transporter [Burkholderiaceae bacterium]|nr:MAG: MFS transporter [Burkholderiaceae bacterium]
MSRLEIRTSATLASIFGLRMLGLFLILPVFAVHARSLPGGGNTMLVGIALGIYGLTQGVLQIPFGIASDRFGRKPVIVFGLLLFALGSLIAALAPDIGWTIAGRAVQGAGAISAAVTAFIADATREEHRTKAMAMVGSTIGLTFALSLIFSPVLYRSIGMAGLFGLTGVLSLLAIGVVLYLVPPAPQMPPPDSSLTASQVIFKPELLRLNVGIFTLHLVQMAMFVVVPPLLIEQGGLPLSEHWKVYLPVVLISFALMVPPIIYAERHGKMKTVFVAAIALLALVQLGWVMLPHSLLTMAAILLAFFVAFNILEASLPSMVSRVAPPGAKGLALGVYNTTQALGLFAGGALGGVLSKYFGATAVFGLSLVLSLVWWLVARGMRELPKRGQASAPAST